MLVEEAVARDLAALAKRAPALAEGSRAAAALTLARMLDDPETSPSAAAAVSRELDLLVRRLEQQAPAELKSDELDLIRARRHDRRAQAQGEARAAQG